MKSMILAFIAAFVLAFAADNVLDHLGFSSADRESGAAVRLD